MLKTTKQGLYCEAGGFHVDPWRPVDRALITHGHSDHARSGAGHYLTASPGVPILRSRLGRNISIEGMPHGETRDINGVKVSFHPAGHVLGSSQIRLEYKGEVWVVSGDYKLEDDGISGAYEPVKCHTFITESTFGLPVYKWQPQRIVAGEINHWWRNNIENERASVLFAYSLGKAQRILSLVDPGLGPIFVHGSVAKMNAAYAESGVVLPETCDASGKPEKKEAARSLVVAPASVDGTPWLAKFGSCSTAFASGWMRVRGGRRRGNLDRGFVISDHVDWPGLLQAIEASSADRVLVTHGYSDAVVRYLNEKGRDAGGLETQFAGETGD